MNIAKQLGATDCGLYAIAQLGTWQRSMQYSIYKEDLRKHLQSVIEKEQITEFSYIQR